MDQPQTLCEAEKFFTDFLTSQKLRLTSQRKIIFNELMQRQTHIDTDALHATVKQQDAEIGLATVYRTLRLLVDAGIVREVSTSSNNKTFYEAVIGRAHHDHLSCEKCGENIEFNESDIESLQEKIAERYNYKLTGHALYLTGICENCRKKTAE